MPASYFCIKAFSETDFTDDLKAFDVPTLILHGDDDQIVPIQASGMLSAKIVKDAQFEVYKWGSHGMCTMEKEKVNADLLAFIQRYGLQNRVRALGEAMPYRCRPSRMARNYACG
jgi:non-heme chloroperoxidase